jgi:hypothetical protein
MYLQRDTEARSWNHYCCGKAISITYSACVCVCVALVTKHTMRMRRTVLSSVDFLAMPYFSTLSHKRYDFREKVVEQKVFVLIFYTTLSETFLILGIIPRDIIINVCGSSCKVPVIPVGF